MENNKTNVAVTDRRSRLSREGYEFDPDAPRWKLSRDTEIELESILDVASPTLYKGFSAALAECAQSHSAWHTSNMNSAMKLLLRTITSVGNKIEILDTTSIINFKAKLDKRTEYHLGRLVGFFNDWSTAQHPGLDAAVVPLLYGWTLAGNPKGEAVTLRCPLRGPLTTMEFALLQERIIDALEDGKIDLEDFTLISLFIASGRRPTQLADAKWCDFTPSPKPETPGMLEIARRKGKGSEFRAQFKTFAMSPELNLSFLALRDVSHSRARSMLPAFVEEHLSQLPIFPDWRRLKSYADSSPMVVGSAVRGETLHSKSLSLGGRLTKVVDNLSITSDRMPGSIHVTPIRLRRTLATRAAKEGCSVLIIAELLDHTDTQNAEVYTENVPESVDVINDAVANQLAPLVRAFQGEIIPSEEFAARGSDKMSRIRTGAGTLAGSCKHCGSCTARAPIACYTCRAFQPWLDGDHEAVLVLLLKERQEISDSTIAEACDLSIFAVREVILLCKREQTQGFTGELE